MNNRLRELVAEEREAVLALLKLLTSAWLAAWMICAKH
jgi:hypothetical protein